MLRYSLPLDEVFKVAPAHFPEVVGARVAQLAGTILPAHPVWLAQWQALVAQDYGADRYRVALERMSEQILHPGAALGERELAARCEFGLHRLHDVLDDERNDRSLQRLEAGFGDRRGDWGDRVKSLREEFRGPGFDVACELVLNFLGGEEEQSQQEISSRTGVPQRTVGRRIGAVRTRVGQLFRRPRVGG
jgi:hypothetical protein